MRKKQGGYYGTVYIRTWWSYCKRNSNHSIIRNNNDSNLSCWKYGRLRDFKNNRGIVVEVFLEEHGESIIYGLIGLVMVVTITAVISRGIVNIVPDYKKELSRNNSYQIEKNEYKYPTIIADEVIYADYGDTTFNYMDYIRARDYRGGNITDKVKVYGKVDVNQKGIYRLRCTVISYFNLACTKYINIIVE